MDRNKEWFTSDEIRFIENMGSGKEMSIRIQMLRAYMAGMKRRKHWGHMNKKKIRLAALNILDKAKRGTWV